MYDARMKNEINSLDAPKGYKATEPIQKNTKEDCCIGCAFESSTQCGLERNCTSRERKDKQIVIFVKE